MVELARALHVCGTPAHRLEAAVNRVCAALDVRLACYATPTVLFVSGDAGARILRVEPADVQLERLVRVDALSEDVAAGRVAPREARVELAAIEAAPPRFGALAVTLAIAAASGGTALFFGGGPWEVGVSAALGLGVGLLARLMGRSQRTIGLFEVVAALFVAAMAGWLSRYVPVAPRLVTLAGIIVLVPGFTLTVGIAELATRNLAAGTARLAAAVMGFLQLGLGAAIGWRVAGGNVAVAVEGTLPPWAEVPALVAVMCGLGVIFQARPRDFPAIVLGGFVAFHGAGLGASLVGPELGVFVGAVLIGMASNLFGRLRNLPASLTLVPGILLLVPGSRGFNSFRAFLEASTLAGVDAAFWMLVVAASLVGGLLVANALVTPRGAL